MDEPIFTPFHEASLPEYDASSCYDGLIASLAGDRQIQVWRIKDSSAYCLRILAPTLDGKRSDLTFVLTKEAAHTLCFALDEQIKLEQP